MDPALTRELRYFHDFVFVSRENKAEQGISSTWLLDKRMHPDGKWSSDED
tara:strand:+ start:522 stop:671 length:150 start_codon:yes stop_codon:yes gene_type:complete